MKINGTVNGDYYINILKYCAIESLNHHFADGEAIFQQDNSPYHTAKVVQTSITKNNLTVLAWPGKLHPSVTSPVLFLSKARLSKMFDIFS